MPSPRFILILLLLSMTALVVDGLAIEFIGGREGVTFSRVGGPDKGVPFDTFQPQRPLVEKPPRPGNFDEIRPGMTIEAVEQALGGPHTELLKLQSTGQVDPDTRIWKKDGMTIVVFFNKEGRVIGKAVR